MFAKVCPTNEGAADRVVRVVLGLVLIALVFFGPKTPWGWIGLLPLVTGALGTCPAYTLMHWTTNKTSPSSKS